MSQRVRIVLQARTSSSRLPAKPLLPIGGMPLALLCARRLGSAGRHVLLATSDDRTDDMLTRTAQHAGLNVFRGSLNNVLERFLQCTADLDVDDIIVRATADNPLPNGDFIEVLIRRFGELKSSYVGTTSPDDGLPYGLSAEVFSAGALRRVAAETHDALDFEHVTTTLRRQAGGAGIVPKGYFFEQDFAHLRATIDTLDDYLAMANMFADVQAPVEQDWKTLVPRLPARRSAPRPKPPEMRLRKVGSSIALGTAQLGMQYGKTNRTGQPGEAEAAAMLSLAVRSGISHLDTARAYGDAESRIGRLLSATGKDNVKIVTKLRPLEAIPNDAPEREIRAAVDASVYGSCRDLRRDVLDVLMFHRGVDMLRWQGAAARRAFELAEAGVVGDVGVSVYTPEEALVCLADRRVTFIQIPFNLLDARWLGSHFQQALAARPDVQVHTRSVFLQGLLVNPADMWPRWVENRDEYTRQIGALVRRWKRKNAADLCVAYVRGFEWVSTLVLGAETLRQAEELMSLASEPALAPAQTSVVQSTFTNVPMRLLDPSQW